MPTPDSTRRFNYCVDDYARFRPTYPPAAIDCLKRELNLNSGDVIADIGAGTGIFSRLLLHAGFTVIAVEPASAMRHALEQATHPSFRVVSGTAENTNVPADSIDLYAAAQAFHWFDGSAARPEALRILKPPFRAALLWNNRVESGQFLAAYEALLQKHSIDYLKVKHQNAESDGRIPQFFGNNNFRVFDFTNDQICDREAFLGRTRSSSYVPKEGHANFAPLMADLNTLFDQHEVDGTITLKYETRMYVGSITTT